MRQGSPASPFLFLAALDWALAELVSTWRGRGMGFDTVGNNGVTAVPIGFADDLTIMARSPHELRVMVRELSGALAEAGAGGPGTS